MIDPIEQRANILAAIPCHCIGPQNGEPLCPCRMRDRGVYQRNGRWIEPARDLGPVRTEGKTVADMINALRKSRPNT